MPKDVPARKRTGGGWAAGGTVKPVRSSDEAILTRVLRLNALLTGLATGALAALTIFVATNWLVLKGGKVVGPHLVLLGQFFIGYKVTFVGSLIGLIYGFVCGFLVGVFAAALHNWFSDLRHRRPKAHA